MTLLRSTRQIIGLLCSRGSRVRLRLQSEKLIVDDLYERIDNIRRVIAELQQQARDSAYAGQYRREALFRARGKRAVVLYAIAQREAELAELMERFRDAQRDLDGTRRMLFTLERREGRHRERLAAECRKLQAMREMQIEQDYLEGVRYGIDQYR
jgi:hypothetical protein